ncbi:gluconate 2-dehydrogenase subunit 3 family protein [Haloarcula sp. S1CR25-12]|uniref:Gluconate 2-dehydrogenase subunit 3 family protein n=1 Tax=Haloarcula saliterrae TaxID=2950534 RepID=A0ABU2FG83_9EURY|nr:gluconate 2-dehydrogenase subunit 3 family protein [Haloarcula sp. S1CR25-12]MDS0261269.1 gluconate 2-dehydrogenase subunit 3 family protein [Haloarcula sp. S1CR25-12]
MQLSQPDAVSALGAAGIDPATEASWDGAESREDPSTTRTLLALAEVLYPSVVEVTLEFVETYLVGRSSDHQRFRTELERGAETLDDWARDAFGDAFARLDVEQRDSLLRHMGVRLVDAVPDGTELERLHYHVVEELLVAFYTSPTGAELAGAKSAWVYDAAAETPGVGYGMGQRR